MLNLTQLRYFMAVAKAGNVTKVAQELYITQSALSRVIFRLESELGVKLFDRIKGRLILNETGAVFLEHVTAAMDELDLAVRAVSQNVQNRPITIYNMLSISQLLSNLTELWQADFPMLSFEYMAGTDDPQEERLRRKEALVVLSPHKNIKGYRFPYSYEERWCVMHNRHYQFQAGDVSGGITMEQLVCEPIVFFGSLYDQGFISQTFSSYGLTPNLIHADSVVDSGNMINRCRCVGLVPLYNYRSVRVRLEGMPNRAVPILDCDFSRKIYLGHPESFPTTTEERESFRAIAGHIEQEATKDAEFDFFSDETMNRDTPAK